jgi:hypothetical protein
VLLAADVNVAPQGSRCEKSERVFHDKWWGRHAPLELDPRKVVYSRDSPRVEPMPGLSGLLLDDAHSHQEYALLCHLLGLAFWPLIVRAQVAIA